MPGLPGGSRRAARRDRRDHPVTLGESGRALSMAASILFQVPSERQIQ
jgi:hypothetical protein